MESNLTSVGSILAVRARMESDTVGLNALNASLYY